MRLMLTGSAMYSSPSQKNSVQTLSKAEKGPLLFGTGVDHTSIFRHMSPGLSETLHSHFPDGQIGIVYGASTGAETIGQALILKRDLGEEAKKYKFIASDVCPQSDAFDEYLQGRYMPNFDTKPIEGLDEYIQRKEDTRPFTAETWWYALTENGSRAIKDTIEYSEEPVAINEDLENRLQSSSFAKSPQFIIFRNSAYLLDASNRKEKDPFKSLPEEEMHITKILQQLPGLKRLVQNMGQLAEGSVVYLGGVQSDRIFRKALENVGYKPVDVEHWKSETTSDTTKFNHKTILIKQALSKQMDNETNSSNKIKNALLALVLAPLKMLKRSEQKPCQIIESASPSI